MFGLSFVQWIAVTLILAIAGYGAASIALLLRLRRSGTIAEEMIRLAFLPEKRRRFLTLIGLEGSFFLLSGLAVAVTLLLGIPFSTGAPVAGGLFLTALGFQTAVTMTGLRPSHLTAEEKERLRREMPSAITEMAFLPVSSDGSVVVASMDSGPPR